jgi:hypothetical protein
MQKISFVVDFVVGDDEDFSVGVARSRIETNVRDLTKHYAVVFKGEKYMDSHGMKVWSKRCAGISMATPKPVKTPKAPKVKTEEQEATPA